jgi:hypothetical protein
MSIHMLGTRSTWSPTEAAMMEIAKTHPSLTDGRSTSECNTLLSELEAAVKTLRDSANSEVGETGGQKYLRLLRACTDALAFLSEEVRNEAHPHSPQEPA